MKNFKKTYLKIESEQEEYVQKIKSIIYDLLEQKGVSQRIGCGVHSTFSIIPNRPQYGHEFHCETQGTEFNFTVRVMNNFIQAWGIIPGQAPVKMVTKKWYSLKKLEKEFLQVFGKCFYKSLTLKEMFENKSPLLITV